MLLLLFLSKVSACQNLLHSPFCQSSAGVYGFSLTVETPVIGHYREREKCPLNRRFASLIVTDTTLTRASFFKWNEKFLPHIEVSQGRGSLLMFREFLPRQLTFYFSLIPFAVGVQSSFTRSFKVWSSIQKQEQMQQTLRYKNEMYTRSALSCPIMPNFDFFVVVDLVISSLLFSHLRAKQSTHLLHVPQVFQIVISKISKETFSWVFNPLHPKISIHILNPHCSQYIS